MILLPGKTPAFTLSSQPGNTPLLTHASTSPPRTEIPIVRRVNHHRRDILKREEIATTSIKFPKARLHLTERCPFHLSYHGAEERAEQRKAEAFHRRPTASVGF